MHPECRRISTYLPKDFLMRDLISCQKDITDSHCLHENLMVFIAWKEARHRKKLSQEMLRMFPQYSAIEITEAINRVPIYINANYAICKALTVWQGFDCPAYRIPHIQDDDGFIPPVPVIEDEEDDFNKVSWGSPFPLPSYPCLDLGEVGEEAHCDLTDTPPSVNMNVETAINCDPDPDPEPNPDPNFFDICDINNFIQKGSAVAGIVENMDPQPSTSKNCNTIDDLIMLGSNDTDVPQVVEVNDVIEQIIDLPNMNEPQPSTSNADVNKPRIVKILLNNTASASTSALPIKKKRRPQSFSSFDCPVKYKKKSEHSHAFDSSKPIVIVDEPQAHTSLDQKLLNTLTELFPDCEREYLATRCRGKHFNAAHVDEIAEQILTADYPRKQKEEPIDFDGQLDIMMSVLPDADPEFLSTELSKIKDNEGLKVFMSQALEFRNYPKLADVEKRKKMCAQARQYTTDFNPEEFLRTIPDPESYFKAETFRAGNINKHCASFDHMNFFLRNHFKRISVRKIVTVLARSANLLEAVEVLEKCMKQEDGVIVTKRKRLERGNCDDIPLLQLFAYIEHKTWILATKEVLKIEAERHKQLAIRNKEVNTCGCCFDDEVMPEDTFHCPSGCLACRDCIKRSAEILFSENNLQFPCLSSCGEHIALDILQACIEPKIFCKIAKRKQLEEVRAAGIDDLEICPFCDFAAIPAAEDKVFKCFNPECMKETCRMCKEPSHIPLHCDEVEKDKDVKQRVYIENQMTEALMRKCWRCNLKFIKSDGCNKISCQCGATMCYICNQPNVDYKHFNGLGGTDFTKCALYSNTDLLHEENAIKGGIDAKKQLGVSSLKVDPLADAEVRIIKAKEGYKRRQGEQD